MSFQNGLGGVNRSGYLNNTIDNKWTKLVSKNNYSSNKSIEKYIKEKIDHQEPRTTTENNFYCKNNLPINPTEKDDSLLKRNNSIDFGKKNTRNSKDKNLISLYIQNSQNRSRKNLSFSDKKVKGIKDNRFTHITEEAFLDTTKDKLKISSENLIPKKLIYKEDSQLQVDEREHKDNFTPINTLCNVMITLPKLTENIETNLLEEDHQLQLNIEKTEKIENSILKEESLSPNPKLRLENIKQALIELVNETKDKYLILKELDLIYKSILKISFPPYSGQEEDNMTLFNMGGCFSSFNNEGIANFNNISHVSRDISTSLSKPSLCLNNLVKDASLSNSDSLTHLNFENESLKKENSNLHKKVEDIDKKFEMLLKENQELKGFVNEKSNNLKTMESIVNNFQSELNEVKRNQQLNNILINPKRNNSKEIDQLRKINNFDLNGKNFKSNSHKTNLLLKKKEITNNKVSYTGNKSKIVSKNSNVSSKHKQFDKDKLVNYQTNTNKNKNLNGKQLELLKSKVQVNNYSTSAIPEEERSDIFQTSLSFENLSEDEARDIYYYPKKVFNTSKINEVVPKININSEECDIIKDSTSSGKKSFDLDQGFLGYTNSNVDENELDREACPNIYLD